VPACDAYYDVATARTTLRGRRDLIVSRDESRIIIRLRAGAPARVPVGLRADMTIDALNHVEGVAPSRFIGLCPKQCSAQRGRHHGRSSCRRSGFGAHGRRATTFTTRRGRIRIELGAWDSSVKRAMPLRSSLRNIAIIAHVDHGKTTWLTPCCAKRLVYRP